MPWKFVRFVAVLAIMLNVVGTRGVALADRGVSPIVDAPQPRPLDLPALLISPASSLGVQFVHVATAANTSGYETTIDHPLTNGNSNAILFVTPNWNPGGVGGTIENHRIGVYYDGLINKWKIFNQDNAAITVGAAFNVIIPAGAGVFVHVSTAGNTDSNYTLIDNALTNGNPNAMVFVMPNFLPEAVCGCVYDDHPIGVFYDGSQWGIINQDLAAMPVGAGFNVFVLAAGAGVFVHTATAANTAFGLTTIDHALTNGNPNAIVFITPNYNPGGVGGTYDNHNVGVFYDTAIDKWGIFNQDGGAMPENTSFNVLALVPVSDIFVHTVAAANSDVETTSIDNALTNSHPNAIVFTTPNYNPGGGGGTFNNHNISMFFNEGSPSQWGIFNQDAAAMPVNAAFNVLIPNPDTRVFIHKATAANTAGHMTTIDYPLTNGKPYAVVFVTPNYDPGGIDGALDDHPIGVYYTSGKWTIFNQDLAAMPVNASFNVFVPTASAGVGVFVHSAIAGNSAFNYTMIDNPLANGNPNALVIVTPNLNPGGGSAVLANYRIGARYTASRWVIFNQDGVSAIPANASFNVYVVGIYKTYLPLILR